MAIFKSKTGNDDSSDSGVAASTHPEGAQTVDRAEDKALPDSKPDEIAPVPTADGSGSTQAPKPAPSATGYRVAQGKSISAVRGDLIDAGQEIGPSDVADIKALVASGHVVETAKTGDKPERPQDEKSAEKTAADKVVDKLAAALKP